MKRKSLLFLLLFALLAPWTANAQTELTVCDGTTTNSYVPFYGYMGDAAQHNQMIYPASDLTDMVGKEIYQMAFYVSSGSTTLNNWTISLGETTATTLSSLDQTTTLTQVYSGSLATTSGVMTIVFDNGYVYNGGNLLVDFNHPASNWGSYSFYGIEATSAAYTYNAVRNFLPKNTFSYQTPASCPKPTALTATANGQSATLTWSSDATQFAVAHSTDPDADPSSNVVTTVSSPTHTMNNLAIDEDHYFWVRANCSATDQSAWAGPVSVHIGYCMPAPTSVDGEGITNVTFGMGSNVVNNDTHPTEAPYYGNYSSQIGALQAGVESTVSITYNTCGYYCYNYGTIIWVDLNNNMAFEDSEILFAGQSSSSSNPDDEHTLNAIITIPPTQAEGNYRMRIGGADSYFDGFIGGTATANHDPCYSGSYTIFEDYTLRVLAAPNCLTPTGLALTTDGETVTATWNGTASTYNIDINGTVTPNVTSPYTFACALSTTYTVMVQANCDGGETSDWSTPATITTPDCLSGRTIEYTLVDSYGDGWNGNAINIVDECGAIINTLTLASGSSTSGTLEFCEGYYEFVFLEGSYKDETSWTFTEGGVTLFSGYGEDVVSGEVLYTTGNPTKPTDIRATPDTNSAELSWSENGTATAWQICLDGDEANLIAANTNPFTLTGLVPGNIYGVKVRSVNGGTYTCWSSDYTFVTIETCEAPTVPTISDITLSTANVAWTPTEGEFEFRYRELAPQDNYFEDGTLGDWTTIDADGDGKDWYGLTTEGIPGYNGSTGLATSASYQGGALTPDNYLVSPQVTLGGSISFWACNQDAYAETIGVAVSTASNDDPADFTTLKTVTLPITRGGAYTKDSRSGNRAQTPWVYIYVDLSAYAGQTGYVAIRHYNCTDKFRVNVDNIIIEQPGDEWTVVSKPTSPVALTDLTPETNYEVQVRTACQGGDYSRWMGNMFTTTSSCVPPTELDNTPMPESATLSWNGYQETYNLRYRPAGAAIDWDSFTQVGTDQTATGEYVQYSFDLSAYEGQSGHVAIRHYNVTDQYWLLVDDIAYGGTTYNFDDGSLPTGWMLVDHDGDGYNWAVQQLLFTDSETQEQINAAYSGEYGIASQSYINNVGALTPDNWIILPYGNLGGTITLYAKGLDESYAAEVFGVYVTTQEIVEEQEWIVLEGVTNPYELGHLESGTTYEWQVEGVCTEGTTGWSEVDTFTTPEYCDAPVDLLAENVTEEGATLSWTGYQNSFDLRYREAMQIDLFFYEDFSGESIAFTGENLGAGNNNYGYASGWYGFNDGTSAWIFWPDTELEGSQYIISDEMYPVFEGTTLEFGAASSGEGNTFRVGFSSTDNEIESFTWSDPIDVPNNYIDLDVPEGTKYFAIEYPETSTSGYTYFLDFIVYANYVAPGEWVVVEGATSPYELTGLDPNTEYQWQVMGHDCDGNGTDTEWSLSNYFTTLPIIQTVELFEGWNWFSTYIELDDPVELLQMLENGMGDSGIQIEQVIDGVDMNAGDMWAGDLMFIGLMNEHTYMIEVNADVTVELQGRATNPADHPITIYPGEYSWIGFPCAEEVDVNVALSGFEAEDGDMIETVYGEEGGIIYNYGGVWVGDFDTMIPGRGYIYFSNSDEEKTLIIQTGEEEEGKSSANPASSLNLNNIKANIRTIKGKTLKQSKINSANTTQSMYKIQPRFKRTETAILQSKINK